MSLQRKILLLIVPATLFAFTALLQAGKNPEPAAGWKAYKEKKYAEALSQAQAFLNEKPKSEGAHWLAAAATLAQGDTTASLEHWFAVLNGSPAHPQAVKNTVEILIAQADSNKAQTVLDVALARAKKPDLPEFLYSKGLVLNAQGKDAEAMVCISQAIEKNPKAPLFYIALARVYEKKGVNVLAKENYLKAISLDSTEATYHYDLAEACMDLKLYNEALEHFKITRSLDPDFPNVDYQIGKLYFYAEKYEQAVSELDLALKKTKQPSFYLLSIYGQALRGIRQLELAQEYLEKAYALRTTEISTARALASNSMDLKKYQRSIEVFEAIIAGENAEPGDYAKLGDSFYYLASKDQQARAYYDSSIVYLRKAAELEPENSRYVYMIGLNYFSADQYDSALVYLNRKVQMDSTYLPAYINLGYSYIRKERYSDAIRVLRQAIGLDSTRTSLRMMLAQSLHAVDSTAAAMREFQKTIEIDPSQADAYGSLGIIYLTKQNWSSAYNNLQQACRLAPQNVSYWVCLGQAAYYIESYGEAERAFRKALEIDPRNKDARNGLETVEQIRQRKK